MKTLAVLIMLAIQPVIAVAQWSNDPNQNTPIGIAAGEQVIPLVAVHPSGTTYIAWFSQESGNYNVRLQKLDILGNKLWADDGLLISNNLSMSWLTDWGLAVDQDECAVLVFQDIRNGNNNIYAYRISPQGEFLWGSNGLALSNNTDFEAAPIVTITAQNNAVFAWSRENTIMIQKVNSSGQKLWGETGIQLQGAEDHTWPTFIPVQEDEILMAYFKQTGPSWAPTKNLFIQRFDPDGQQMWGSGIAISNNAGIPAYVKARIISDGDNGAFVTWHRSSGNIFDAYVQHVKHNGNLSYPVNGLVLSLSTGTHQLDPVMAFDDSSDDLYLFWREHDANQNNRGISGQRISSAGNRLWGDYGKVIIPMQSGEKASLNVAVTDGEPVITFSDSPSSSANSFLRAIRLDNNGNTVWLGGQRSVSTAASDKLHVVSTEFINDQLIMAWEDKRNDGGDIYAQNLKPNGTLGPLQASLNVYPQLLQFHEPEHFMGLDFVVKNNFPVTLTIDSMTETGNVNDLNLYYWYAFTDESPLIYPVEFNQGDSLIFTVGWDILLAPGREYLSDTVFIWSGGHEYHVIIEMDPSNFPSGIEENDFNKDVNAWPNPFSDQINISFPNPNHEPVTFQIFDKMGKMVNAFNIPDSGSENVSFIWDGRNASGNKSVPGVYLLRVVAGTHQKVLRVLYMSE
jgi:hypothetical protein